MIDQKTAPYAALLLRLALGLMFLAHAAVKIFVFTMPGTVGFFQSLGLPGFVAYLVTILEVVGGIALILGFKTRLFAIALAVELVGVVWAHAGNGWMFASPNGGWEYPAFLFAATLALALLGDGKPALALGGSKPMPQPAMR